MFTSGFNPLTPGRVILAGAPAGHDVRVLAELAVRVQGKPLIFVAQDDVRAALVADALGFFAPQTEVLNFPAWDCLPYDRISPHADIAGERLATLGRLRKAFKQPCILITTINAIVQKTVPPEVLQQASLNTAVGDTLPVESLRGFLAANGYVQTGTVREPGEYAVRGGIVDLFPTGYAAPLRLDYFGDEIESIRVFDALSQTTTDTLQAFALNPISEVLLDERSIAHFRTQYRALFGAVTDNDPLYEAVTAGRKFPGVEHWLGLFYPHMSSLFDYAAESAVVFDHQSDEAITSRLQQIDDFYQARTGLYQASKRVKKNSAESSVAYKPAPVGALYLDQAALDKILAGRAVATLSPFGAVD